MARSKDSSPLGTSGWLFGSEADESDSNQTENKSSELQDNNNSRKRSSSKSATDEKATEASVSPSEPALFDNALMPLDENKKQSSFQQKDLENSSEFNQTTSVEIGTNFSKGTFLDAPSANSKDSSFGTADNVVVHEELEEVSLSASPQRDGEELTGVSTQPVVDRSVAETGASSVSSPTNAPTAYQVVARRYRPQAFGELIGQETVTRALSNAIETNRVGHAYLFTGARGVGKTSCARIFAKALNCVEGPTIRPCLKCDSCVGISTGEDVDVIEIDGASNRGVDEIRQLRQNAAIAPSRSRYKIYIIDEVHMLTREAFNALLKTLEEPPARVKFIFCTTEPNKIPITILSRCQRFDFNAINGNSISSRLKQIAELEGSEVEEGVFDVLARRANGSMRDAQSLLEQLLSFSPNYISLADVHNMLGSVDDGKIFELICATVQGDAKRVFELLGTSAALGVDFGILIEQTFGVYRDLMIVGSGCGASELIYSPVARFNEIKQIAERVGLRRILASLQIIDQTIQRMRYSAQARILAELAFARLCQLDAFQTIESLINQLKNGAIPQTSVDSVVQNPQHTPALSSVESDKKKITTT